MKKLFFLSMLILALITACATVEKSSSSKASTDMPAILTIEGVAQNPEGIEYNKNDDTFFLSALNGTPIIKINSDGTYEEFTSGEQFPLSTVGLEIDYKANRLLAAGADGAAAMDNDPATKGVSFLRIYNLETGVLESDINLSSLVPDAAAFLANDITVDSKGNIYITDMAANVVYKVDTNNKASVFWKNNTGIPAAPNGIVFNEDGYLLVALIDGAEYSKYGLVKIPVDKPESSKVVKIEASEFHGFDGMILNSKGNLVGVTGNGKTPGGSVLLEISGQNDWESATVENVKDITISTTVAVTPDDKYFVINQDFMNPMLETWKIEQIQF